MYAPVVERLVLLDVLLDVPYVVVVLKLVEKVVVVFLDVLNVVVVERLVL